MYMYWQQTGGQLCRQGYREAACMCHHITRTRIQSNNFETHHVVGEHAVMECKPWDRNVSHGTGAKVVSGGDSREYW